MSKDQKFSPDLGRTNSQSAPELLMRAKELVQALRKEFGGYCRGDDCDIPACSEIAALEWAIEKAEGGASARLIAAAPDLLSIAKLAYRASQIDVNDLVGRVQLVALMGAIGGMAKVAIAKAEGRE